MSLITTVCVNQPGVDKAHFEVVQHCWLMEIAESCEVILPHQDIWVSQWWQVVGTWVYFVLHFLERHKKVAKHEEEKRVSCFHFQGMASPGVPNDEAKKQPLCSPCSCSLTIKLWPHFHTCCACPNSTSQLQAAAQLRITLSPHNFSYFPPILKAANEFVDFFKCFLRIFVRSSNNSAVSNNPSGHIEIYEALLPAFLQRNVRMALRQKINVHFSASM